MNVAQWEIEHVRRFGERVGLIAGDRSWTNAQILDRSRRLASALIRLQVAPGDCVAIVLPNCPELYVAASAAWMAGAAVVVFTDSSEHEVLRVLQHCKPGILISTARLATSDAIAEVVASRIIARGEPACSPLPRLEELIGSHEPLEESVRRAPEDAAQLCYTSGVTGTPKAVVYTHGGTQAFWNSQLAMAADAPQPSVAVVAIPPTAFGARFIGLRVARCTCHVLLERFEPEAVLAAIERHRATEISLVPTMAEQLAACRYSRTYDCSSLRFVNISGAHVSSALVENVKSRLALHMRAGGDNPGTPAVIVHYGLTEAGGGFASTTTPRGNVVGRIAPMATVRIVDEDGNELPSGTPGQIIVRSPFAASEYWHDPQNTAAVFRNGFVYTGDVGMLDADGELHLFGRQKEMIIQGGFNVLPNELVDVVRELPGVRECAVVGVANDLLGEEVVVCIVRSQELTLHEGDVRARLRARLDPRKQPTRVLFLQSLPKTHNGKTDGRALARDLSSDAAGQGASHRLSLGKLAVGERRAFVQKCVGAALAPIVAGEEGPDAQRRLEVLANHPFGALGLDSIGAVRLTSTLGEQFGCRMSPTLIYSHPTITALSEWLLQQIGGVADTAEPAPLSQARSCGNAAIAIVGIGCRLPGGVSSPQEFWDFLLKGEDAVRAPPAGRGMDAHADWRAAFLERADHFDAAFFGLADQAAQLDPRHRLVLEVAWESLEDAGCDPLTLPGSRTGVFLGIYGHRYGSPFALSSAPGMAVSYLCHFLDIRGPVMSVDTTCSSSLVAVHHAVSSLRAGECDLAVVGGVNLIPDGRYRDPLGVMSTDGRTRAFDAAANGFGLGEGCVMLVLKRVADAAAAGDAVHALIRGVAINHDGRATSLTAPNPIAQQEVIRLALNNASLQPASVQYVEAHGTGTLLGDPVEADGLARAFGAHRDTPLTIGSVKTSIGHLEAAAGVAGLLKATLAVEHGRLPASLHFAEPNPHVPWDRVALRVQAESGDWPSPGAERIAGVSSYGMSGTNAHVIVAEYREAAAERRTRPGVTAHAGRLWVLPLSAKSPAALQSAATRWAVALESGSAGLDCHDIAYTASCRRAHLPYRMAVVGRTPGEWAAALRRSNAAGCAPVRGSCEVVMMLRGSPAAHRGCGRELYANEGIFRESVLCAAAELEPQLLAQVLEHMGGAAQIAGRENEVTARLALLLTHIGMHALWCSWGVRPRSVRGEGVGEAAAAHVMGAISLAEAVARVRLHPESDGLASEQPLASLQCVVDGTNVAELGISTDREALEHTLGRLFCLGYPLDWSRRHAAGGRVVRLPSYPWQHASWWHEVERVAPPAVAPIRRHGGGARELISQSALRSRVPTLGRHLRDQLAAMAAIPASRIDWDQTLDVLGIDSLGLIRLQARMAEEWNIRLPPRALHPGSTVAEALYLFATEAPCIPPKAAIEGPLRPLRLEGAGPLNIWIHPIGGGTSCYQPLVRALPYRAAGIEMPALRDARQPLPDSLQRMSSDYIALLDGARLERPFILCGWSLGGLVAFEMAAQLQARGDEVALVTMIDSYLPTELPALDASVLPTWLSDLARTHAIGQPQHGAPAADTHLYDLFRANLTVARRYVPPRYDGRVLSIRAVPTPGDPDASWRRLAPRLEVEAIAGDHYSIMRAAAASGIVTAMRSRIAQ